MPYQIYYTILYFGGKHRKKLPHRLNVYWIHEVFEYFLVIQYRVTLLWCNEYN